MSKKERSIDMIEGDNNNVYFTRIAPEFKPPDFDPLIDSDYDENIFTLIHMGNGSMQVAIDMIFDFVDEMVKEEIERHKKDYSNPDFEPQISDKNRLGIMLMPEKELEQVH